MSPRVVLNVVLIVAAIVFLQELVLWLYEFGFQVAAGYMFSPPPLEFFVNALPNFLISTLVLAVGFGGGAFVSLRWVAPVIATLSWRRVALRGLLAGVFGAVGVLVLRVIQGLLASVHIGPYPLGYSFSATLSAGDFGAEFLNALGAALSPFVYNLPLIVLACVFLRLWSARVPAGTPLLSQAAPAKGRASASA